MNMLASPHRMDDSLPAERGALPAWAPLLAIALLALASSITGIVNGFAYDDHYIIKDNARVHDLGNWARFFWQTYWYAPLDAGLYRPWTVLWFAIQWAVADGAPWPFHAVNIALYVGVSVAVYRLARDLLPPAAAWIAAALFAVHPVHVEVVGNVVGQGELWAALFMVFGAHLYIRARLDAPERAPTPRTIALLALVYALACLSKEHGVLLLPLLGAAELLLVRDPRPWMRRITSLLPAALTIVSVAVGYLVLRASVPGVLEGAEKSAVLTHFAWSTRALTVLVIAQDWARLLIWPAELSADYNPMKTLIPQRWTNGLLPGAVILAALVLLALAGARRSRAAAFGVVWMAVTLAIASGIVVPTGVLVAERLLFAPSIGFVLAVGAAAAWIHARVARERTAARALGLILGLLLLTGAYRSAQRQRVWKDNDTLFAQTILDAPFSYKAHWQYGGHLFEQGNAREGEREIRIALKLWPLNPLLHEDLAIRYMANGLCEPALPLLRGALKLDVRRDTTRFRLLSCLFQERDFAGVKAEVARRLAEGPFDARFPRAAAVADSAERGFPISPTSVVMDTLARPLSLVNDGGAGVLQDMRQNTAAPPP